MIQNDINTLRNTADSIIEENNYDMSDNETIKKILEIEKEIFRISNT